MSVSTLYWREPLLLLLLLIPILLVVINRWWQQKSLLQIADSNLIPWLTITVEQKRRRLPFIFLLLGWIFLCIALAGPRTVKQLPPDLQPDPSVLMVVIDLSASMNARDVHPDRRTLAQQLLKSWLPDKPSSLAIGVILFSGHAFTLIPPTTDENLLSHFADSLTDIQLPTAGNDLAAAIELAEQPLLSSQSHRRLWVLMDGDMETAEQKKVAELFNNDRVDNSIQTRFIGIGKSNPVTIPDPAQGLVQFQGRAVLSRIESAWMKQLAKHSSINYQHYRQVQQRSLDDLLQLPALRLNEQVKQQVLWQEWFSYPLLLGLVCLMVSIFFNSRQLNRPQNMVHSSVLVGLLILLAGVSLTQSIALADDKTLFKQAQQALQQKNYPQARQLFAQLNSMQGHFGEATACYRMNDYECAKQAFSAAAWLASDDSQRAKAVFNLANSYFFAGDYDQAVVLYRDAELLGIAPELCAINLRFAESMQASIQKQIKHIQLNFKRAQWKAAVSAQAVPSFSDFSNDNNLIAEETNRNAGQTTYQPSSGIMLNELKRQLRLNNGAVNRAAGRWIETDRVLPQSTAGMINRLFEMELGIPAKLKQPQLVEGKRAW